MLFMVRMQTILAINPVNQDNGDGTVSDLVTGLMWQKSPDMDGDGDFNSGWPYLDLNYFDLVSGQVTKDEQYWTSDYYVDVTVEGGSESAFGVNHGTG